MARKYRNEIERQYFRERDRIRKALERMERRGILQRGAMSNKEIMPKIPKRITRASVSRLQKMTTASLYKNAELVDYDTGEILAAGKDIKRVERERKRAARKGQEMSTRAVRYEPKKKVSTAQLIIDNIKNDIRQMGSNLTSYMLAELAVVQEKIGLRGLARLIEENASAFHEIIDKGTGQYKRSVVEPLARRFDRLLYSNLSRFAIDDIQADPRLMAASLNLRTAANTDIWESESDGQG